MEEYKSFEGFLGSKEDIKTFDSFLNPEKNVALYEIKLPIMKLEELLTNVNFVVDNTLKSVLVTFFKTYSEYIDLLNKRTHEFKINDMTGDITASSRVVFNAYIFSDSDVQTIKTNIVNYAVSEFFSSLPDTLNIFGIEIKTSSYINKEELKYTFDKIISIEETVNIITNILNGYNYEGQYQSFYVWSNKPK